MNGRFQMQAGKNRILPKEVNANRFFWASHWLEIWSNNLFPSMGPNGRSVAMDSGVDPSIRRHSGILGTADEAVLNIVRKNLRNKASQKIPL
jgi:hypothetical protein